MGRIDENKKPDRMHTKTGCVGQQSSRFVHLRAVPIHIRLGIHVYEYYVCVCRDNIMYIRKLQILPRGQLAIQYYVIIQRDW